jgi:hypothetical protein
MSDAAIEPPFDPDWSRLLKAFTGMLDDAIGELTKIRDGIRLIKTLGEERQKQATQEAR